ncbi:serine/threonine-protein kinase [Allorhizocola rhizosphaerae]|uniref:serine/threonine-protein kinase n=1 Tax=Allorhizocola rhizosphaerae TaxID=1872709 RepID=UPI000E3BED5F|nr:serine/threonine-protein kinase [Allorhizocola rhizosphaerae]
MLEIAGYRILRRLGEGGMGAVYLAEALDGGQRVAIKVIHGHLLERQEFRERFRREVARAKTVPPFCTAEVIAADPDHEPPYLVIEYVDGPSLFEVVQQHGPLRGARLHSLAVGVATALTAIHGAGVIHRDLKPGNVLVSSGSIKVIDFGLAREIDSNTGNLTTGDEVIGTVPYLSPERLGGARVITPAADIFAWGGIITFAATGRTPFRGATPADTAISILSDPPDLSGVPAEIKELVERALDKDPELRPTARELLDALLNAAPTAPRAAVPEVATVPMRRPKWRGVRLGLMTAGLSVVLLVTAAAIALSGQTGTPTAQTSSDSSLVPRPSPSLMPTLTPSINPGLRPMIEDRLTSEDGWSPTDDKRYGRCTIGSAGLTATLYPKSAVYRCKGRHDQTTDFDVSVDVKTTGNSCAAIWFRYQADGSDGPGIQQPDGGYALQICGELAVFVTHETAYRSLREMKLRTSVAERGSRIRIVARGTEFTFYQDGEQLAIHDDNTFHIGRVALGMLQRNGQELPGGHSATFTNLVLHGTSVLPPQTSGSGRGSSSADPA